MGRGPSKPHPEDELFDCFVAFSARYHAQQVQAAAPTYSTHTVKPQPIVKKTGASKSQTPCDPNRLYVHGKCIIRAVQVMDYNAAPMAQA